MTLERGRLRRVLLIKRKRERKRAMEGGRVREREREQRVERRGAATEFN